MGFINLLIKTIIRLIIYIAVFMAFVWLLLGIPPQDTWTRSWDRLNQMIGRAASSAGDIAKTAGDMKNVAGYHLQQAADRIDGKDPYEDFNAQLSEQVRRDLNQ